MKIFTTEQIRKWDAFTIEHEPVSSIDLMERASRRFVHWFRDLCPSRKKVIHIFCGPGNNGGDGFAVARMLAQDHYTVKAYLLAISLRLSPDCEANFKRIKKSNLCPLDKINENEPLPVIKEGDTVIDAIFGSGLSRPIEDYWMTFIEQLNKLPNKSVSIDIPSGMFADKFSTGISFRADHTFSFEIPKLGFFFHENQDRVGQWAFGTIGLSQEYYTTEKTPFFLIDKATISKIYRPRKKFSHKGTYGHALIIAGSFGSIGAAVLAARGALRSGVGLLTVVVPKCGYEIMQTSVPEAMVLISPDEEIMSPLQIEFDKYSSIGIGCGLGKDTQTEEALGQLLSGYNKPIVLDADALNMIAENPELFKRIPKNAILTPHPKEFERFFGRSENSFERLDLLRNMSKEIQCFIVLKGAHTIVACPDGDCYFNNTGNAGMATAGSGDVLTGIVTGLLSQGYASQEAAILGVYLHGLSGDIAKEKIGEEALIAGDIISHLGNAFEEIKNYLT